MPDRLYRSRTDRMVGGVCGGIAEALRIDPTIVRVGWVLMTFATNGALILVYFVLLFVVPEAPEVPTAEPPGGGGVAPVADRVPSVPATARDWGSDGRTGALVFGAILVLVGAYFLLRQYLPSIDFRSSWPFVAVGLGIVLVVASLRSGGRSG